MRSIKGVVLSFGTLEKVKLYKARNFFEMTVTRSQTCSNAASDPLATRKRFIAINMLVSLRWPGLRSCGSSAAPRRLERAEIERPRPRSEIRRSAKNRQRSATALQSKACRKSSLQVSLRGRGAANRAASLASVRRPVPFPNSPAVAHISCFGAKVNTKYRPRIETKIDGITSKLT